MGNLTQFMRVAGGTQEPGREPCCSSPALHGGAGCGGGGLAVGERRCSTHSHRQEQQHWSLGMTEGT